MSPGTYEVTQKGGGARSTEPDPERIPARPRSSRALPTPQEHASCRALSPHRSPGTWAVTQSAPASADGGAGPFAFDDRGVGPAGGDAVPDARGRDARRAQVEVE